MFIKDAESFFDDYEFGNEEPQPAAMVAAPVVPKAELAEWLEIEQVQGTCYICCIPTNSFRQYATYSIPVHRYCLKAWGTAI